MDDTTTLTEAPSSVLTSLMSPLPDGRLPRFNLLDTVSLDNGSLLGYSYTQRDGTVVSKKSISKKAVRARFSLVSACGNPRHNPQSHCCVLRGLDGSFSVLDQVAFTLLTATWPPPDPQLVSLSPWVPGSRTGVVYRNSYAVVDDKGRTKTATHT